MNYGATRSFRINPEVYAGTYEVILGSEHIEEIILSNDPEYELWLPENLFLIPARKKLENAEIALRERERTAETTHALVEPVEKLRGKFDYVFLDTGPNTTLPTIAAYKAADLLLLTALPETFAVDGLRDALRDFKAIKRRGGKLTLLGLVLSCVDRRPRLARELLVYVDDAIRDEHGEPGRFRSEISRSTIVSTAQKQGKTIFETEPEHKVTDEYRALAREFEARIARFEQQPKLPAPAVEHVEVAHGGYDA
jgi:chromosome partitioning protein